MFFFLPILFFISSFVIIRRHCQRGWRISALLAAIGSATVVIVFTEILSLFHAFCFYPILLSWFLLTIIAVILARRKISIKLRFNGNNFLLSEKIFLSIIVFVCLITAITALFGVPNTWDSMTYHLSRVEHWIQNGTVAHYPTNITRQLFITPFAEFTIAHLRLLGGGESCANWVQWMAMLGSLIGGTLIAQLLGSSRKGQLFTGVLIVTIPMGILQAVSTQTDYMSAFWLVCSVIFLIQSQRNPMFLYKLSAGLSIGLALLTKGNNYIFIAPFLIWYIFSSLKAGFRKGLLTVLIIFSCSLMLNAGQYWRNIQTFGSPSWTCVSLMNESFGLKLLWVNVLRNAGLHMGTPWDDVNQFLTQILIGAAHSVGADINDPRASFSSEPFAVPALSYDEDVAGNFLHLFLVSMVLILCWIFPSKDKGVRFYVLAITIAFILFCLLVRYQPWHSRFHLPLFVLFCPAVGIIMERFLNKKIIVCLGMILFVAAIPWMFFNHQHPWGGYSSIWRTPKQIQYFYKQSSTVMRYASISAYLKAIKCNQVGLLIGEDTWEYPWWAFLKSPRLRIEHVHVDNQSAQLKYPLGDFQPCALISTETEQGFLMVGSNVYIPVVNPYLPNEKNVLFLKKV